MFVAQLFVGIWFYREKIYTTPDFDDIRSAVITNYTQLFYDNTKNESLYKILSSAESSLRDLMEPQMVGTVIDPTAILNVMFGINEKLAYSDGVFHYFFFFCCNIVIYFIMICLCHIIDQKYNSSFDNNWVMAPCPPRDIVLDFRKQLDRAEREGKEVQFKVCSLGKPLPPEPLRNAFLWPIRYPRPALMCLVFFIIFSMSLAVLLLPIDNVGFFQALTKILNYCNMIDPFPLSGTVWMFLMWVLAFLDLIAFNYTIYSLSLLFLDVVFWIVGVEEEFTPVLLE
ncbi:hypothetical protein V3C99_003009 [Haemonchus contortus]